MSAQPTEVPSVTRWAEEFVLQAGYTGPGGEPCMPGLVRPRSRRQ